MNSCRGTDNSIDFLLSVTTPLLPTSIQQKTQKAKDGSLGGVPIIIVLTAKRHHVFHRHGGKRIILQNTIW